MLKQLFGVALNHNKLFGLTREATANNMHRFTNVETKCFHLKTTHEILKQSSTI